MKVIENENVIVANIPITTTIAKVVALRVPLDSSLQDVPDNDWRVVVVLPYGGLTIKSYVYVVEIVEGGGGGLWDTHPDPTYRVFGDAAVCHTTSEYPTLQGAFAEACRRTGWTDLLVEA